jgi:hypothetical protein
MKKKVASVKVKKVSVCEMHTQNTYRETKDCATVSIIRQFEKAVIDIKNLEEDIAIGIQLLSEQRAALKMLNATVVGLTDVLENRR